MEQYSSLLLGMGGGGGGGRESMEQYSSLLLGVGMDESLRNNIHHCC